MAHHDWPLIRREYVEGFDKDGRIRRPSMRELADRHGVQRGDVYQRASAEKWTADRKDFQSRVNARRAEVRSRTLGDEAAGFDRTAFDNAFAGLAHVTRQLAGEPSPLELAAIARALLGYQAAGRKALGLTESAPAADNVLTINWIGHDPTAVDYD